MRFSLKWALAVTAYVAFAAAAFRFESEFFADAILWGIAILACCYAMIVVVIERGRSQAKAIGFAVLFAAYMICLWAVPARVPSSRLLKAAGYEVTEAGMVYTLVPDRQGSSTVMVLAATAQSAHAIAALVAGLIGSLLGLLAFTQSQKRANDWPHR
jgi:hypothetical protein